MTFLPDTVATELAAWILIGAVVFAGLIAWGMV